MSLANSQLLTVDDDADLRDLPQRISHVQSRGQRPSAWVYRLSTALFDRLKRPEALEVRNEIITRVGSAPAYGLTFAHNEHQLSLIEPTALTPVTNSFAIQTLASSTLQRIVEGAEFGFYRASPTHHYVAPSGVHCRSFFRLGDIIQSRHTLDELAFWILPHVARADAIIVDNWSIVAVLLRALVLLGVNRPFDCLRAHPKHEPERALLAINHLLGPDPNRQILFLASVSSSGSAAAAVTAACAGRRLNSLALYALTPPKMDAICVLSEEPGNAPADQCQLCPDSTAVRVDPTLFAVRNMPEKLLPLKPRLFFVAEGPSGSPSPILQKVTSRVPSMSGILDSADHLRRKLSGHDKSSFCARYSAVSEVFWVHHRDTTGRHHAFHVNMSALLAHPSFQSRLEAELVGVEIPDAVVCQDDDAGALLGDKVAAHYGRPLYRFGKSTTLPSKPRSVIVVDDQVITGERLQSRVRELREDPQWDAVTRVNIVVALARPTSARRWGQITQAIAANGQDWSVTVVPVEKIWLPDWTDDDCPWCAECRLLEHVTAGMAEFPELDARTKRLAEHERGIREEPLWANNGRGCRSLGRHSFVGPAGMSPIVTLFAVVQAVQRLREDEKEPLNPSFPYFRVLNPGVLENYSEALLQGALLRAVRPREWPAHQREAFADQLGRQFAKQDRRHLIGELILSVYRGSVDRTVLKRLEAVVRQEFPLSADRLLMVGPR